LADGLVVDAASHVGEAGFWVVFVAGEADLLPQPLRARPSACARYAFPKRRAQAPCSLMLGRLVRFASELSRRCFLAEVERFPVAACA
jgi:hypothetical protein